MHTPCLYSTARTSVLCRSCSQLPLPTPNAGLVLGPHWAQPTVRGPFPVSPEDSSRCHPLYANAATSLAVEPPFLPARPQAPGPSLEFPLPVLTPRLQGSTTASPWLLLGHHHPHPSARSPHTPTAWSPSGYPPVTPRLQASRAPAYPSPRRPLAHAA